MSNETTYMPHESIVREIVRAEIASLAGLALRRLQDKKLTRSFTRNEATDAAVEVFGHFWGEVLAEYGSSGPEVPVATPDEGPPPTVEELHKLVAKHDPHEPSEEGWPGEQSLK